MRFARVGIAAALATVILGWSVSASWAATTWGTTATATANGRTITTVSQFTAAKTGTFIFDIELYNSSNKLQKQWYSTVSTTAGKSYSYTNSYTVAADGKYHVDLGVFTSNWGSNPAWKQNAAVVTVGGTTTSTTSTSTTSTSTSTTSTSTTSTTSTTVPTETTTSTTSTTVPTETTTSTTSTTVPATPPLLVGMGASWTAGAGNEPYTGNANCYRSASTAYPVLAAQQLGFRSKNVGCSGADTADIISTYEGEPAQTSQLAGADWIVINAGGNDYDFWGVIESGSTTKLSTFNRNVNNVNANLQKDLAAIKKANPTAKIVVLGYADFIPATDSIWKSCASTASRNSVASLHSAFTTLNNNIQSAANAYGATFVNPTAAFAGHGICDSSSNRWIYTLSEDWDLHPNAAGQNALATLVANAIRNS